MPRLSGRKGLCSNLPSAWKVTDMEQHPRMSARARVRTHSLPTLPRLHQRLSLVSSRKWGPRWQMRLGGGISPLRNTVQIYDCANWSRSPRHGRGVAQGPRNTHSLSSACTPESQRMRGTAPRTSERRAEGQRGRREGKREQADEDPPAAAGTWGCSSPKSAVCMPTPASRDTGLCAWWRGSPELRSAPAWLQTAMVEGGRQRTGARGGRRLPQAGAQGLPLHPAPTRVGAHTSCHA